MVLGFKTVVRLGRELWATNFEHKIINGHKKHTIREDAKGRWKVGNKIHFATGVRTSKYNCFAHGVVSRIEDIEIKHEVEGCYPVVKINGEVLPFSELGGLAKADGFNSVDQFCQWFKEDFKGKIIHWSNVERNLNTKHTTTIE